MNMYDDEDTDEKLTWKHLLYYVAVLVSAVAAVTELIANYGTN